MKQIKQTIIGILLLVCSPSMIHPASWYERTLERVTQATKTITSWLTEQITPFFSRVQSVLSEKKAQNTQTDLLNSQDKNIEAEPTNDAQTTAELTKKNEELLEKNNQLNEQLKQQKASLDQQAEEYKAQVEEQQKKQADSESRNKELLKQIDTLQSTREELERQTQENKSLKELNAILEHQLLAQEEKIEALEKKQLDNESLNNQLLQEITQLKKKPQPQKNKTKELPPLPKLDQKTIQSPAKQPPIPIANTEEYMCYRNALLQMLKYAGIKQPLYKTIGSWQTPQLADFFNKQTSNIINIVQNYPELHNQLEEWFPGEQQNDISEFLQKLVVEKLLKNKINNMLGASKQQPVETAINNSSDNKKYLAITLEQPRKIVTTDWGDGQFVTEEGVLDTDNLIKVHETIEGYQLIGAAYRYGATTEGGHIVSFVNKQGTWYLCDDEYIKQVSPLQNGQLKTYTSVKGAAFPVLALYEKIEN